MLMVNPKFAAKTVQELVAPAKADPGKLSYAASNSTGLVTGETFKRATASTYSRHLIRALRP